MSLQLFAGRPVPKKRVVVPLQASGLDTGFNEAQALGGGISPGGPNAKYANSTPGLANPLTQLMGLFKKKKAVK
jgi:hypothetical protein